LFSLGQTERIINTPRLPNLC